jgi:hypothetical protein
MFLRNVGIHLPNFMIPSVMLVGLWQSGQASGQLHDRLSFVTASNDCVQGSYIHLSICSCFSLRITLIQVFY